MPDNQQVEEVVPEFITEERVVQVFGLIDQYSVWLEQDPTVLGPSYIHEKLKDCRDHSNGVERLLVEFYDVERKVKNMSAGLKEAYKAEKAELLVLDDEVAKGKSAADREAIADYKLKKIIADIAGLREQLVNVQYVLKAIELKKEGLNRTNNDIKKQVALMEFAKTNSRPLASDEEGFDLDDLLEPADKGKPKSTPEAESEDIGSLFSVEGVDGPTDIENHSDDPPEQISETVAKHLTPEGGIDPVKEDGGEDPTSFLAEIKVELEEDDLMLDLHVDEEIDAADLADLFAGAEPVDEKSEEEKKARKKPIRDDSALDIGAFLDMQ